jgi:hypothetical protein
VAAVERRFSWAWLLLGRVAFALSCGEQFGQPDEIVACDRESELRTNTLGAAQHGLGERADRLAPAEDLLDPLADALAQGRTRRSVTDLSTAAPPLTLHVELPGTPALLEIGE